MWQVLGDESSMMGDEEMPPYKDAEDLVLLEAALAASFPEVSTPHLYAALLASI